MTALSIALVTGLIGMIGWGTADFLAKKTIDRIGDLPTLLYGQLIGLAPLSFLLLLGHHSTLPPPSEMWWLPVFGVVSALSYLVLYRGFGRGQVSILSPIFASYVGTVVLMSAFLFAEFIPAGRWIAIGVLFCGIVLMSLDLMALRSSSSRANWGAGVPEVLIAMIVYSFWLVYWSRYVDGRDWVLLVLTMRAIATVTLLCTAAIRRVSLRVEHSLWIYLVGIGLFDVLAYGAVTYGFSATSLTSVVALLSGAFSLPTVLLARAFLKERLTGLQWVAVGLIITGIGLIEM